MSHVIVLIQFMRRLMLREIKSLVQLQSYQVSVLEKLLLCYNPNLQRHIYVRSDDKHWEEELEIIKNTINSNKYIKKEWGWERITIKQTAIINVADKLHWQMLKLVVEISRRDRICIGSKYLPQDTFQVQRKRQLFNNEETWKIVIYPSNQENITCKKASQCHEPFDRMHWEGHNVIFMIFFQKCKTLLHSWENIWYSIWPVLFKRIWKTRKDWGTL